MAKSHLSPKSVRILSPMAHSRGLDFFPRKPTQTAEEPGGTRTCRTVFESQHRAELPTLLYSDWLIFADSSFGLGTRGADHRISLVSQTVAGRSGRKEWCGHVSLGGRGLTDLIWIPAFGPQRLEEPYQAV